jgi:hypothetical protein
MTHQHDDVLAEVKEVLIDAFDVEPTHPDTDRSWWVTDTNCNTFALAWYDESDTLNTRPYHP